MDGWMSETLHLYWVYGLKSYLRGDRSLMSRGRSMMGSTAYWENVNGVIHELHLTVVSTSPKSSR